MTSVAAARVAPTPRRRHSARTPKKVAALGAAALLAWTFVVGAGRSYIAVQQATGSSGGAAVGRRGMLQGIAAAASGASLASGTGGAAWAAAADTAAKKPSSKYAGSYLDPDHEGCKREIFLNFDGTAGKLVGQDSFQGGACAKTGSQKKWSLKVSLQGPDAGEISIQEETRSVTTRKPREGGPSPVVAKWDGTGLVFPDGTKWTKSEFYEAPEYDLKKLKTPIFR